VKHPVVTSFEERLVAEISAIDRRVSELMAEKAALTRQLLKAREQRTALRDVTRINSGQRVIVEESILEFLKKRGRKSSPADILAHVRKTAVHDLNSNTLRTYLWRMREKGVLTNPERGSWDFTRAEEGDSP
jgi:hypothetical protein